MYALWKELSHLENTLPIPRDAVEYLRDKYFTHEQQIQCISARRTTSLGRKSFIELKHDSMTFRFLPESDSIFEDEEDYVGFVIYSYEGKRDFTLNNRHYQRGDILIKNMKNLPNNLSKILSRNSQVYHSIYKSLLDQQFQTTSYEGLIGLRIIYEQKEWQFNGPTIGSDISNPFSPEEHLLLEMFVLSYTKDLHNEGSIRNVSLRMIDEQFKYIKSLLEKRRSDMEAIWPGRELNMAVQILEWKIENEIDTLFYKPIVFNTFAHIRGQNESCRLAVSDCPSQASLWQIWKQLESIEIALFRKEFHSLNLQCLTTVERLFHIPIPLFLDKLGICPNSDAFDPEQDYAGILTYLDKNSAQSNGNEHRCQCGQVFLVRKENISKLKSKSSQRKSTFASLFIHEQLYEFHFNKKPDQHFHGIGFNYEQGQWKFNMIIYAGESGIHSIYDNPINTSVTTDQWEQYCLDLLLFTLYMNNGWEIDLGSMYTIVELETIARELFRKKIEAIEKLFHNRRESLEQRIQIQLKKLIEEYKPNTSSHPITVKIGKIVELTERLNTQQTPKDPRHNVTLINSHCPSLNTFKSYASVDGTSLETQTIDSNVQEKSRKSRQTHRPNAFPWKKFFGSRTKSLELSSSNDHIDQIQSKRISIPIESKSRRNSDAIAQNPEASPPNLYQLWIELRNIQTKLDYYDFIQFCDYLMKKDYLNGSESIILSSESATDANDTKARTQIDGQFQCIRKIFNLKKSQLSADELSIDRKKLDESFKAFEKHYEKQIKRAKKPS